MFKKLLCLSAAFVLCFTSFIVPSYANDYEYSFAYQPLPIGDLNSSPTGGFVIYRESPQNANTYYRTAYSSSDDTCVFHVSNISYGNSNINNGYVFASPNLSTVVSSFNYFYNNGNIADIRTTTLNLVDSDTGLYFYVYVTAYGNSENLPSYTSLTDGLNAVNNFIESSNITDPIYDDLPNFNIQRGYAAYIDFGSDWNTRSISGTLTSSFPQYSSLISGDWDGTDNRRYFWTDSLPNNTNFTSNVGNAIDWTKVPPYDLLQRSKNGIWFIQSNSPLNRYLVIVNPNQWRYGQNPTDDTINSPITVSDLSGSTGDVQFFALNQKFDSDGTLVSAASDNASNNRTGTYDPDTGQWQVTDSSGNAADQVPGGESDTPVISSITDYIHNITSVLTNFANSVISLIQAPISHISELIEAGSGFMASLRGMYSWLPVDIQGLVISALTVVIGIGVFKVFL